MIKIDYCRMDFLQPTLKKHPGCQLSCYQLRPGAVGQNIFINTKSGEVIPCTRQKDHE